MLRNIGLCAILVGGLLATPGSSVANAQNRVALVVGNSHYSILAKDNLADRAVPDAAAVAGTLLGLGFHVTRGSNLGRRALFEKIGEFREALRPGDIALLYFAGHGVSIDGLNYLVPADVPAEPVAGGIRNALVSLDYVLADIRARGPEVVVAVLDAFRPNPFRVAGNRDLVNVGALEPPQLGTRAFTIHSAGIGQLSLDRLGPSDTDPNSLFVRVFIQHIVNPNHALGDLMPALSQSVAVQARGAKDDLDRPAPHEQMPTHYDKTDGKPVYLAGPRHPTTHPSAVDNLIRTHPALPLSPPGASAPPVRVQTVPILPRDPPEQAGVRRHSDYPMTRGPGPYVVQVASQRTEEDARASFAALQAKYPAALGERQPLIQRTDLGERGVYYRAHVGPFPTAEEAGAMCTSLKEAGGQCVVQRHQP